MRILCAVLLLVHGFAHLVGFRAAFWPSPEAPAKTALLGGAIGIAPLAGKLFGSVWLLLAVAYLSAAGLLITRHAAFSTVALSTSILSLSMCVLYWPEAKIGLFIDIALLFALSLWSRGNSEYLSRAFENGLRAAALPTSTAPVELVTEGSLASLPEPVRRYLRFMGVVGRPRDTSLRASFRARFRREPGEWLACEAVQYDTRLPLSRLFYMQLSLEGALPVTVRDTYLRGRGRMLAKAFDWIPVVDGSGYELDVGELVTYLNDAILFAPSLVLGPETQWQALDERSFSVRLRDGKLAVSARVWLDEQGAPKDFSTTDRFYDAPDGRRVRTEWRTPISGWQRSHGRRLPTRAQAIWMLPSGPFAYADFEIEPARIAFNTPAP